MNAMTHANLPGPDAMPIGTLPAQSQDHDGEWGSLFEALYTTDVIPQDDGRQRGDGYNPKRAEAVIRYATEFLDRVIPLHGASHADVSCYHAGPTTFNASFCAELADDREVSLRDPRKFRGTIERDGQRAFVFCSNGLHIELRVGAARTGNATAPGGVCDVVLEAQKMTLTTATLQAMRYHCAP